MRLKHVMLIVFLLAGIASAASAQVVKPLSSHEVILWLKKNPRIVVLDVRTPEEFAGGHIKGAKNIDIRQQDFFAKVDKLDKKADYLVYCRTNHRSTMAVEYMSQHGFVTIYQMMDGFTGWTTNNLPFER